MLKLWIVQYIYEVDMKEPFGSDNSTNYLICGNQIARSLLEQITRKCTYRAIKVDAAAKWGWCTNLGAVP